MYCYLRALENGDSGNGDGGGGGDFTTSVRLL